MIHIYVKVLWVWLHVFISVVFHKTTSYPFIPISYNQTFLDTNLLWGGGGGGGGVCVNTLFGASKSLFFDIGTQTCIEQLF